MAKEITKVNHSVSTLTGSGVKNVIKTSTAGAGGLGGGSGGAAIGFAVAGPVGAGIGFLIGLAAGTKGGYEVGKSLTN